MSGSSSRTPVATRIRRAVSTRPPARRTTNPGSIADHLILDQLHAVAGHLGPSRGQQVGRRHPVAGQEPLHVRRGSVARRAGIDHGDPAPRPAQHERRTQAGRTAADHHHVIGVRFHGDHLHQHAAIADASARGHFGIHQFASPRSFIRAGTSRARMTVASKMIPAARPIASGLIS